SGRSGGAQNPRAERKPKNPPRRGRSRFPRRRRRHSQVAQCGSPRAGSSSAFESGGESFREPGLSDCALRSLDVVPDATKLECLLVDVPESIACCWQTVARLSDASWIHERGAREVERIDAIFMRHGVVRESKDAWHMGVAVKADSAVQEL